MPKKQSVCLVIGAALASVAPFAAAQTAAELERRIAELEKRQQAAVSAGAGSGTSVKIGGYAKLDTVFSSRSAGVNSDADQLLTPQAIPVGPGAGDNERKQIKMHARESRLNVATRTPTEWGALTTLLEGDFFGAAGNESVSNSHNFRLRHAYGTLGNFSAGQYWTNFMNVPALPETLDFNGPVGNIFVRQAQLRWTQQFSGGEWAVSAENPESVFAVAGTGTTFRADDDRYPDFVGRVSFDTRAGRYWVAGLARNIRIDSAAAPAAVDNKWGGGIAAGGLIPVIGKDDLRFMAYGGNGVGRYNVPGFYVDGVIDAAGGLSLPTIVGGYAAYRHFWTPTLRSTLVLSASRADNPSATFGTLNKSDRSVHLNLISTPVKAVDVGVEYIYGQRKTENEQTGTLNRVQLSAKYAF